MFPQPYNESADYVRRSIPSSLVSGTCTHDPLFNENLKVVDMCKNRDPENCIDVARLFNKKESGYECKDFALFAGKYTI